MIKRRTVALAAAVAAVVALATSGCSTGSSGPVTIVLWNGFAGTENKALTELVDKYWAPSHPDIKVKIEGEKTAAAMLTAMSGSDSPDVVIAASSEVPSLWYQKGAIRDLSPLAAKLGGKLTDAVVPAAVDWGKKGDTTFALPFVDYDWGLYYNKAMFQAAGLDPDKPPTTIDELAADAKKLTVEGGDGSISQLGWVPAQDTNSAIALSMAFGATFVDKSGQPAVDQKAINEAITWDSDLAKSIGIAKVEAFTAGFTNGDNPFSLGKAAMYIDGSWAAAGLKDSSLEWGFASVPASAPEHADATPVGTNPLVIPKAATHEKEAEKLITFLATDPELSGKFAAAIANIPQVTSQLGTFSDDPATTFFAKLTASPNAKAWAPVPYAQDYIDEFTSLLGRVYSSGEDVSAVLKDAQKDLESKAAEYTK